MGENNFGVFTVCNIAYLPKVLVLAESLHQFHGQKLNVVIFDERQDLHDLADHLNIIWVGDLGLSQWRELAFMYDIIEFSTSLKPFIALQLLKRYSKVIFLDPDTAIFSRLDPILEDLNVNPVVLTPHYRKPQPETDFESDLAMMRFGSFNLGFFAVRQSSEAEEFLMWWNRRCINFSFMESQFGLSTDQKWVSIAPCFFDYLKISFNSGYNAAPWNTFERIISQYNDGSYFLDDGSPLIFFHFSNFDHTDPQYLNKRASCEKHASYGLLEQLGAKYSQDLKTKEALVKKVSYAFDYMSDGSYISPTLRRAYASIKTDLPSRHDPFDSAGPVGAFARQNHLFEKDNSKYTYPSLKEATKHSKKFLLVYCLMRQALRILGPNRFYDLSKLMVYLSIYRKNISLWKLK
jgi:hypothetical protein